MALAQAAPGSLSGDTEVSVLPLSVFAQVGLSTRCLTGLEVSLGPPAAGLGPGSILHVSGPRQLPGGSPARPAGWIAVTGGWCPRLAELAGKLEQEGQFREAACSALQKSQEDASQRVDSEVAKMQVPGGRLGPGSRVSHPSWQHGRARGVTPRSCVVRSVATSRMWLCL